MCDPDRTPWGRVSDFPTFFKNHKTQPAPLMGPGVGCTNFFQKSPNLKTITQWFRTRSVWGRVSDTLTLPLPNATYLIASERDILIGSGRDSVWGRVADYSLIQREGRIGVGAHFFL